MTRCKEASRVDPALAVDKGAKRLTSRSIPAPARQFNSTLPARKSFIAHSSKSLPRVNATRKARKAAKYKAFLSSAAWKRLRKAALERAGYRCEQIVGGHFEMGMGGGIPIPAKVRCPEMERLTVHHRRYSLRFGGDELPSDLVVLCKAHHDRHHALEGKSIA